MSQCLHHERELTLKPGHRFGTGMFEVDGAATDGHLIIRAVGQVDDLGRHLSG